MSKHLSVEVSGELLELMEQAVSGGDFNTLDEIVVEALHIWRISRHAEIERLRELVAEGEASGFEPWEGIDAILARARAERESLQHTPYRAA